MAHPCKCGHPWSEHVEDDGCLASVSTGLCDCIEEGPQRSLFAPGQSPMDWERRFALLQAAATILSGDSKNVLGVPGAVAEAHHLLAEIRRREEGADHA